MNKYKDITGQRFGKLIAQEIYKGKKSNRKYWTCLCDCGNIIVVSGTNLRTGQTKSCGCMKKEHMRNLNLTHDLSGSRIYHIHRGILARCFNPREPSYKHYGGRGITVCSEWLTFKSFYKWAISSGYSGKKELSLDRINNEGNYEPDNCRWATMKEQGNNRRTNRLITFKGETKTLGQWALKLGINHNSLAYRLKNWSLERALTEPKKGR
jgi:hypothetical protein